MTKLFIQSEKARSQVRIKETILSRESTMLLVWSKRNDSDLTWRRFVTEFNVVRSTKTVSFVSSAILPFAQMSHDVDRPKAIESVKSFGQALRRWQIDWFVNCLRNDRR